ncbi:hypothetical protein, partial [Thiolapillus sp.]|uniref:hypothetical protein n=1 Tax=Thiolapillus sp. TaxID=2017437 RepID=UPI003AF93750
QTNKKHTHTKTKNKQQQKNKQKIITKSCMIANACDIRQHAVHITGCVINYINNACSRYTRTML